MTLILRQVSIRADGGEIVRTQRLDGDEATIGRAEDCGIVLPDLAVRLVHARLRLVDDDVTVTALGGARFHHGGRPVDRAVFRLGEPVRLGFGKYDILVEPGANEGEAVLTVSRQDGGGLDLDSPGRIFSLAGGPVGKRLAAWVIGLAILAAAVAAPVLYFNRPDTILAKADAQWSTGHLSQAHAFLEDNCESCHRQAFVAVRDEACMDCHDAGREEPVLMKVALNVRNAGAPKPPVFIRHHAEHARLSRAAPPPSGLAERLKSVLRRRLNRQDDRCASCHLEHQGPEMDEALDTQIALNARPPIPLLREVETCVSCHTELAARLPDTDLTDAPNWARHPDFRPLVTVDTAGGMAKVVPIRLTDNPTENTGLVFPHALHLSQTGGVARMAASLPRYGGPLQCGTCHQADPAGPGFAPIRMERDCEACHSLALGDQPYGPIRLPHGEPAEVVAAIQGWFGAARPAPAATMQPRRRPGEALELERREQRSAAARPDPAAATRAVQAAFAPRGVCFDCHVVNGNGPADFSIIPVRLTGRYLVRGTFDHRTLGHRRTERGGPECIDCHAAESSSRAADLLLPKVEVCRDCHGRPADAVPHPAGGDCVTCHSFHNPTAPRKRTKAAQVAAS